MTAIPHRSLTPKTVTPHPKTAPDQHQHTRSHCLSHHCPQTERSHLSRLPVDLWEVATPAAAVARAAERAQVLYPVPTACRLVLYVIDGEVVFGTACETPEAVTPETAIRMVWGAVAGVPHERSNRR